MRHLFLLTFILGLILVSALRSTGPNPELVQQIKSMASPSAGWVATNESETIENSPLASSVEKMLADAPFTSEELEQLDGLSQKFPGAANPFQKLCAVEKLGSRLSSAEYDAVSKKYYLRLLSHRQEAEKLFQTVLASNSPLRSSVALRNVAYLASTRLQQASAALASDEQQNGRKLNGALNAAMISLMMTGEAVPADSAVARSKAAPAQSGE